MKGETLMTDVRAVIYVLKVDPNFATFDRDVARLGTWDEYTPGSCPGRWCKSVALYAAPGG